MFINSSTLGAFEWLWKITSHWERKCKQAQTFTKCKEKRKRKRMRWTFGTQLWNVCFTKFLFFSRLTFTAFHFLWKCAVAVAGDGDGGAARIECSKVAVPAICVLPRWKTHAHAHSHKRKYKENEEKFKWSNKCHFASWNLRYFTTCHNNCVYPHTSPTSSPNSSIPLLSPSVFRFSRP